jgi:hypothetical protein
VVGSEERSDSRRDAGALVWGRASEGGCMQGAKKIYAEVEKQFKQGASFRDSCRSVAERFHIELEEVEVVVASQSDRWYKRLGYDVVMKI